MVEQVLGEIIKKTKSIKSSKGQDLETRAFQRYERTRLVEEDGFRCTLTHSFLSHFCIVFSILVLITCVMKPVLYSFLMMSELLDYKKKEIENGCRLSQQNVFFRIEGPLQISVNSYL